LSRPNWSRRLPRPLKIPSITTLKTLANVRELMKHLPKGHRERPTWRHVAKQLAAAADGGDINDAVILVAVGSAARASAVPPPINLPSHAVCLQKMNRDLVCRIMLVEVACPPAAIAAIFLMICCRVRSNVRAVVTAPGLRLAAPGSAQRHRIAPQRRRSHLPRPSFVERAQMPDDLARLLWDEHG
jgi:hypothetical protein